LPAASAWLTTERILVPKMRMVLAFSSSAPSSGIGFMSCTPSFAPTRPLSTFKKGTMRFTSQR